MSKLESMNFRMVGVAPLLVHNERLANPLSPEATRLRKITSKRAKEPQDYEEMTRAEFDGGLYIDQDGPYLPSTWILAVLRSGAKEFKKGQHVGRGILILDDVFRIQYPRMEEIKTADQLWAAGFYDQRMVGNKTNRVLRTRPRFDRWALDVTLEHMPDVITRDDILRALDVAGTKLGFGDYRPRFGRFIVEL